MIEFCEIVPRLLILAATMGIYTICSSHARHKQHSCRMHRGGVMAYSTVKDALEQEEYDNRHSSCVCCSGVSYYSCVD